eukprot:gene33102-55678_t
MSLDTRLLAVLACPEDKGPLYFLGDAEGGGLYIARFHRRYLVRDGIPVMLEGEARAIGNEPPAPPIFPMPSTMGFSVLIPARLASTRLP